MGSYTETDYCTVCGIAPVDEPKTTCSTCIEPKRTAEVDAILAKNGVTRDQVENSAEPEPIVAEPVDDIPIHTTPTAKFESTIVDEIPVDTKTVSAETGEHWFDALGKDYVMTRVEADELESEFPVFPSSVVRSLIKENNKITKRDVESVLAEFDINVSLGEFENEAMALVVSDINDKAGMKKAKELRLIAKKERVRFDQQGIEIKEPLLRRTQLIDGVRRLVKRKFEVCESHLLEQEQFEERELARQAAERQVTRLAELAEFEWMHTSTDEEREAAANELKIGYLSDAEWLVFRNIAKGAYDERIEAERIAAEAKRQEEEARQIEIERLRKLHVRVAELTKLGLNYDGETLSCTDLQIKVADFEHASDEAFTKLMDKIVPHMAAIKDAEFAADQERDRLKVQAEAEKRKADEAAAELKRIADEKAAKEAQVAAEAERKRLAPDAEKLKDLANIIDAIALPTVDPKFHALMNDVAGDLARASGRLKTALAELDPTF